MAREQGLYCVTCQRQTLHRQAESVNHILHLLITLFTCGLWLFIWALLEMGARSSPWVCSFCGMRYDHTRATAAWRQARSKTRDTDP